MGTGRMMTCTQCGEEREHSAHGLCSKCYRAFQRQIARRQEARSELAHDTMTLYLRKAQDKMVKAVYDLRNILGVFKEYGVASEFLEEDSETISTLKDLLLPLLDKVRQTVEPSKAPTDPTPGPSHVQTVMNEDYIQGPFIGRLSQPEPPEPEEPEEKP
jgi:hypothetical protein